MDIDEEELPRLRKAPVEQDCKTIPVHSMPSASVLAAARQLEAEENIKVAEILSRRINLNKEEKSHDDDDDSLLDLSETINEVEMKIKAGNNPCGEDDTEQDELDASTSFPDTDLASCIQSLQMKTPKYTVLRENPGIDIKCLSLEMISECISDSRFIFLKSAIKELTESENEDIYCCTLEYLLNIVSTMGMEPSLVFKLEDYLCSTLLITAIILDRKCRLIRTSLDRFDILFDIMERVSEHGEFFNVMVILSRMILAHFTHFHDRLFIAEGLIRNTCEPLEMNDSPTHIHNRMAKYILYSSLLDLVEYTKERQETKECSFFSDLKHVIVHGKRSKCLDLYEQYILISTLMALFPMVTFKNEDKEAEEKEAFNWLLTFLQSLKHDKHHHTSADLLRVKSLNSLKNLLFQKQVHTDP